MNSYRESIVSLDGIICRPKDQGGLGVKVLDIKNRCLLRSGCLSFKMRKEYEKKKCNKYLQNKSLSQVIEKPTNSPF
jgi:hypothetical protein